MAPPPPDDRPWQEPPPPRPAEFLTRDRAKQYVYRLEQIATERRGHFKGARMGMTSFVEAVPVLRTLEGEIALTIDSVLAGRLRDRERGETEIPFVVAVEGVLERVRRARQIEEARRVNRVPAEWAQETFLGLLADAVKRMNAFVEVYDAKRFLAVPAAADLARILHRVEEDAAAERLPSASLAPVGVTGPAVDRKVPALVTSAEAVEDLLRAARAEVPDARPPWRVTRASPNDPLILSMGEGSPTTDASPAPPSLTGPGPAAERTSRAAAVLKFAHGIHVHRTYGPDAADEGERVTRAVHVAIADGTASAVAKRLAPSGPDVALPPDADAAMRAYVVAAGKEADPLAPTRLVAAMGVLRAVDKALDRALRPLLDASAATIIARAVPRESSRKAPVHREALATLTDAVAGFPSHRVSDVLDAVADGKAGASATKPPDAAVLLAVLSRRWPGGKPFGDVVVGAGVWTDEDAMASIRDVVRLSEIRTALERGRDPGAGWAEAFEKAAFGLLSRLARLPAKP
jgi:hypothetical protein